jgi:hypothetical protein
MIPSLKLSVGYSLRSFVLNFESQWWGNKIYLSFIPKEIFQFFFIGFQNMFTKLSKIIKKSNNQKN